MEDFAQARKRMVVEQLTSFGRSITHPGVLAAMGEVPRHEFVPPDLRNWAYDDRPLPIGHGQTISQPYVVAYMTQEIDPKSEDRVLEVGTGCGYQAAILSRLAAQVCTIEIVPELAAAAAATLSQLGYTNARCRNGDGYCGWPEAAPFDGILVSCAPGRIPEPLIEQLREGGKMVIPVGSFGMQELRILRKTGGRLEHEKSMPVRFVPMTGRAAEV